MGQGYIFGKPKEKLLPNKLVLLDELVEDIDIGLPEEKLQLDTSQLTVKMASRASSKQV
jgi:hypothetical protein